MGRCLGPLGRRERDRRGGLLGGSRLRRRLWLLGEVRRDLGLDLVGVRLVGKVLLRRVRKVQWVAPGFGCRGRLRFVLDGAVLVGGQMDWLGCRYLVSYRPWHRLWLGVPHRRLIGPSVMQPGVLVSRHPHLFRSFFLQDMCDSRVGVVAYLGWLLRLQLIFIFVATAVSY